MWIGFEDLKHPQFSEVFGRLQWCGRLARRKVEQRFGGSYLNTRFGGRYARTTILSEYNVH